MTKIQEERQTSKRKNSTNDMDESALYMSLHKYDDIDQGLYNSEV